jgi:hypothetical protein
MRSHTKKKVTCRFFSCGYKWVRGRRPRAIMKMKQPTTVSTRIAGQRRTVVHTAYEHAPDRHEHLPMSSEAAVRPSSTSAAPSNRAMACMMYVQNTTRQRRGARIFLSIDWALGTGPPPGCPVAGGQLARHGGSPTHDTAPGGPAGRCRHRLGVTFRGSRFGRDGWGDPRGRGSKSLPLPGCPSLYLRHPCSVRQTRAAAGEMPLVHTAEMDARSLFPAVAALQAAAFARCRRQR